jgi:hypothetical protein
MVSLGYIISQRWSYPNVFTQNLSSYIFKLFLVFATAYYPAVGEYLYFLIVVLGGTL